jgi:hypothetical protein
VFPVIWVTSILEKKRRTRAFSSLFALQRVEGGARQGGRGWRAWAGGVHARGAVVKIDCGQQRVRVKQTPNKLLR